jgi:beta-lactamase class D
LKRLLASILACLAGLALSNTAAAQERPDFAEHFGAHAACALFLTRDRHHESRLEYRPEQCAQALSPCSTFKIPNALIALQVGVASGPDHLKRWDGTQHERAALNRDHTLASAIADSVVWYFQSLAREVGTARMQHWLDRLDYGNRDISGGLDRFWLSDSLQINAYRQLDLLIKLKHQTLPFRHDVQSQLHQMLVQDSDLPGTLFGKTGSCRGAGEDPDHGWFIGWVDWETGRTDRPATTWFVVNIIGDDAWGWQARPIALKLLSELRPGD